MLHVYGPHVLYLQPGLVTLIFWDADMFHIDCPILLHPQPRLVMFIKWDTDMLQYPT